MIEPPSDEDVAGIAAIVAARMVGMLRRRGKVEDDEVAAVAAVEGDGSVLLSCMAAILAVDPGPQPSTETDEG